MSEARPLGKPGGLATVVRKTTSRIRLGLDRLHVPPYCVHMTNTKHIVATVGTVGFSGNCIYPTVQVVTDLLDWTGLTEKEQAFARVWTQGKGCEAGVRWLRYKVEGKCYASSCAPVAHWEAVNHPSEEALISHYVEGRALLSYSGPSNPLPGER